MTAISGTLKNHEKPEQSKKVLQFVNNAKEREELYMVLDEELKMISRLCPDGGNIAGPTLRYMSKVIHTEYEINGFTTESPLTILVRTMFAPTVVGSPLESAARIVARYEPTPRGYYSGAIALIEPRSDGGEANLDSAILIRTASITPDGKASIPTGATIVRDSNPAAEAEETTAKAASLLSILSERVEAEDDDTKIAAALAARGGQVSSFWQVPAKGRSRIKTSLQGKRCLILNAEDDFTGMIAVILRSAGMDVSIKPVSRVDELDQSDLIVFGPGPGDPNDTGDTRLARLRALMGEALSNKRRFLAVCLSHQVLGLMLGMPVRALPEPRQGRQEEIIICGKKEFAGFYNTFVVETQRNVVNTAWGAVQISRHPNTMQVYALTGDYFSSVQCHLESILTRNGHQLLTQLAEQVLSRADCLAE